MHFRITAGDPRDDVVGADLLLEHDVLAGLRGGQRGRQLLLHLRDAPVAQLGGLGQVTVALGPVGLTAQRLNKILRDAGVQFKQSGRWFLYAKHAEQGYTQSKTHEYAEGKTSTHMYWTQKGRLFIYDLLKAQGILPVIEQGAEA